MSPKTVKKLIEKKYRTETGLFIVEGEKNIRELLASDFVITQIFGTSAFLDSIMDTIDAYDVRMSTRTELTETKAEDLARMGTFVTNDSGIAIGKQSVAPSTTDILDRAQKDFVLVLDNLRDPGNVGTIIRTADWYGVTHIVASPTTTDFYNPKVISATMGSFTRIKIAYMELPTLFDVSQKTSVPIIATALDGKNTHETEFPTHGFLLLGSESHGVSSHALTYATERVTIPRFGNAESLNVSVATGILLDTLRHR